MYKLYRMKGFKKCDILTYRQTHGQSESYMSGAPLLKTLFLVLGVNRSKAVIKIQRPRLLNFEIKEKFGNLIGNIYLMLRSVGTYRSTSWKYQFEAKISRYI